MEKVDLTLGYVKSVRITGSSIINSKLDIKNRLTSQFNLGVHFIGSTFEQTQFQISKCETLHWSNVKIQAWKMFGRYNTFTDITNVIMENSLINDVLTIVGGKRANFTSTNFEQFCSVSVSQIEKLYISNSEFSYSMIGTPPMLIVTFVEDVNISNCIVSKLQSQWLYIASVFTFTMKQVHTQDCRVSGTLVYLTSIGKIYVRDSHFIYIVGTVLNLVSTVTLELKNSTFTQCHSNVHESVVVFTSNKVFSTTPTSEMSVIWKSTFTKCTGLKGGALYLSTYYKVTIYDSEFIGNRADQGNAIYCETMKGVSKYNYDFEPLVEPTLSIYRSTFTDNHHTGTHLEASAGGAVYVLGSVVIDGSRFTNNHAVRGGAVYIEQSDSVFLYKQMYEKLTALIVKSTFFNNTADVGEIVYSELEDPKLLLFQFNSAESSPNSLGSPCTSLVQENLKSERGQYSNGTIVVYLGEKVSFDLIASDVYGYVFPRALSPINIRAVSSNAFARSLDDDNSEKFYKSVSLYSHHELTNEEHLNIVIQFEKVVLSIPVIITPCPLFYKWESPVCVNVVYLIPTAASVTLLVVVIGLFAIVACCIARNRTKRWNSRKKAEEIMEQALLDKRVLFEDDLSSSSVNNLNRPFIISAEDISIVKKIGEGGAANVFLAKWRDQEVAVKTLKESFKGDNEVLETEAALISSFLHPNVIRFWGLCASSSQSNMVMEYMKGGSLEKLIQNCKSGKERVTFRAKIHILLGVSKGMQYLHGLKPCCVHRDLKPGNILLDEHLVGKVGDFGISRLVSNTYQTSFTTNVGTLFYMAPENFSDQLNLSEQSLGMSGFTNTNHLTNNTQHSIQSYYSETEDLSIASDTSSEKRLQQASKVDVYSFAVIMWSLFFEESPYGNYNEKKMNLFGDPEDKFTNCFTALPKILQGKRPSVPFNSVEKMKRWLDLFVVPKEFSRGLDKEVLYRVVFRYLNMMKLCWHPQPEERPPFTQIVTELEELSAQLLP